MNRAALAADMRQTVTNLRGHTELPTLSEVEKTAVISEGGLYRYRLGRRWGQGPAMLFVMLNPSKADALVDDPTIVRCMGFARRERYAAIDVVNLFAWRSKDPKDLLDPADPVGPEAGKHLLEARDASGIIVAAWGAYADGVLRLSSRPGLVLNALSATGRQVWALGFTGAGCPKHPLYVNGKAPLVYFNRARNP